MATELSSSDVGKEVVSASDDRIGIVADVDDGTVHVDPDPGFTDALRAKLGWSDSDGDTYPVDGDDVATVTEDEVRLGHGSD